MPQFFGKVGNLGSRFGTEALHTVIKVEPQFGVLAIFGSPNTSLACLLIYLSFRTAPSNDTSCMPSRHQYSRPKIAFGTDNETRFGPAEPGAAPAELGADSAEMQKGAEGCMTSLERNKMKDKLEVGSADCLKVVCLSSIL